MTLLLATSLACEGDPAAAAIRAAVELDHVSIYAPAQSSEAAVVAAFQQAGLTVDERRHPSPERGLRRYVYFSDFYLEVIFPGRDTAEVKAETRKAPAEDSPTRSPFSIGLRWRKGYPVPLPIPSRALTTDFLPAGAEMRFLSAAIDTLSPAVFILPGGFGYDQWLSSLAAADHPRHVGDRSRPVQVYLANMRLDVAPGGMSATGLLLDNAGVVPIMTSNASKLELFLFGLRLPTTLNLKQPESRMHDLRPVLPLVLNY